MVVLITQFFIFVPSAPFSYVQSHMVNYVHILTKWLFVLLVVNKTESVIFLHRIGCSKHGYLKL